MTRPDAIPERAATLRANGTTIGYSVRGDGPPLLLIHGAEAGREMFAAFGAELAARFTVVAYDQRDTDDSRDLSDPPRDYQLADLADDAAALIEALGYARAHVFGTSLGGNIAQVLAARHPDRIDRLVLASTFPVGASLATMNPRTAEQLGVWRADPGRHVADIASKFFPEDELRAHPERLEMFRRSRRPPTESARRARLLGVPYPIAEGEIAAPTLLLMGAADALIPNDATRSLGGLLRDGKIEVLPGVGHIAAIQAPAELARVVTAFLLA